MSSFSLNTGHERPLSGFQNRTSDVFASLGGLEKGYDDRVKERGPDEFVEKDRDSPEREESFKRPEAPLHQSGRSQRESRKRHRQDHPTSNQRGGTSFGYSKGWHGKRSRAPDYKVHPERWTEYSLDDTDVSSESANKRAAVDFFRDLRARKAKEARFEEWDAELYCGKIEFKKPRNESGEGTSSDQERKSGSYSDVHKMPEYIIGQAKSKPSKAKTRLPAAAGSSSCSAKSDVSLGHLGTYEESEQPTRSESSNDVHEGNESRSHDCRTLSSEGAEPSIAKCEEEYEKEEGNEKEIQEGAKEAQIAFKKGKGKRKIRERRDDDG